MILSIFILTSFTALPALGMKNKVKNEEESKISTLDGRPDLFIKEGDLSYDYKCDNGRCTYWVDVIVSNIGTRINEQVQFDVTVYLNLGRNHKTTFTVWANLRNEKLVTVHFDLTCDEDEISLTVSAEVDPSNEIVESNERNNRRTIGGESTENPKSKQRFRYKDILQNMLSTRTMSLIERIISIKKNSPMIHPITTEKIFFKNIIKSNDKEVGDGKSLDVVEVGYVHLASDKGKVTASISTDDKIVKVGTTLKAKFGCEVVDNRPSREPYTVSFSMDFGDTHGEYTVDVPDDGETFGEYVEFSLTFTVLEMGEHDYTMSGSVTSPYDSDSASETFKIVVNKDNQINKNREQEPKTRIKSIHEALKSLITNFFPLKNFDKNNVPPGFIGFVKDAKTGKGIPNAEVVCTKDSNPILRFTAITDGRGQFAIDIQPIIAKGTYNFKATAEGYMTNIIPIKAEANSYDYVYVNLVLSKTKTRSTII
jgi:hypothetical protein